MHLVTSDALLGARKAGDRFSDLVQSGLAAFVQILLSFFDCFKALGIGSSDFTMGRFMLLAPALMKTQPFQIFAMDQDRAFIGSRLDAIRNLHKVHQNGRALVTK